MRFEYRLTINDFKELIHNHLNAKSPEIDLLSAGFWLLIYALPFLSKDSTSVREILLEIVLPALLSAGAVYLIIYFIQQFSIKSAWNNSHTIKDETITEIDDEELTITTPLITSILKWGAYTHWKETSNLFLVYQSPSCSSIFPKRAFISAEQIDEFRELLRSKLPNR